MFVIALLIVAGLFVTSAGPAFASEVEVRPGPASEGPWAGLLYRAAPGEANRVLLVTVDDATIDVSDPGASIAPGRGCRAVDAHLVRCSTAAFPGRLGLIGADVRAGDMDDVVETRGPGLSADGGPGDDRLEVASDVRGVLDGGGGRDTLLGGANSDVLIDGDASGAADADILDGREGGAEVSYAARTEPVRVDLARSVAGEPGEGDVIRSISGVIGGAGADDLRGDGDVNGLVGGAGDDRLIGRGGDDFLNGGRGSDHLDGGANDDRLVAGPGRDTATGGAGMDYLDGGRGADRLRGGGDADVLIWGDAHCGAGEDLVTPSANDYVAPDCEAARFLFASRVADFRVTDLDPNPRRGSATLVFRVRCPYIETDGYPSPLPLRGTVRLTTRSGVLVGMGRVSRSARSCGSGGALEGSLDLPVASIRVALTGAGRQLLARGRALVTVRFSGRNVPPVPWRIRLAR